MRFALAFVGASLHAALLRQAVAAPQVEPKRTPDAAATIEVRVVGPDRKAAPQGVELRVATAAELGAAEPKDREWLKRIERGRLAAALGRSRAYAPGADGQVELPRLSGALVVAASARGLYAELAVAEGDAGPVELELHADRSLAVRVSDGRGHALPHVPVAIGGFATNGPLPDIVFESATIFRAVATTREADGAALFEHVQEWIDPDGDEDAVALLAVPHRDHEQVRITPTLLEEGLIDLHAPQFGSVELRLPGVGHATVRLRERAIAPPPGGEFEHHVGFGEWRGDEPLELPVVDGVARCDRIGVGCTLEVEALWSGLSTPFHAEFAGPDRAGASVMWKLVDEGEEVDAITARLTGRLVDGSRRPIASRVLHGRIVTWQQENPRGDDRLSVVTDSSGRFELELGPRAPEAGLKRWLEVGESAGAGDDERRDARGWIDVSDRLGAGSGDLGDVLLVGGDAKGRVEARGEEALLAEAAAVRVWPDDAPSKWESLDLRLNEIARRGGPRVVSFLELQIARQHDEATRDHDAEIAACEAARAQLKAAGKENDESDEDEVAALTAQIDAAADWKFSVDLKWAALLRRAQRKPAPIVVEPLEAACEAVTPDTPRLPVRIHDVDEGFESLFVPSLDERPWRTTVFDQKGEVVPEPPFEAPFICISRVWSPSGMGFDNSYVEVVPIGPRFENVRPGEYRVRVEYMIGDVVAITSGDLPVRIRPVPIRVSRRDYDAMVAWIRAIDVTKPVLLTRAEIADNDGFTGDAETPEDRIARCGRLALPALLDELEETTDDPMRRAWILGLLWNMKVDKSITCEQIEAAVGSFAWSYRWPTVQPHGDDDLGGDLLPGHRNSDEGVARDTAPDPRVQRDLAAIWTELRAWFEFTIEK